VEGTLSDNRFKRGGDLELVSEMGNGCGFEDMLSLMGVSELQCSQERRKRFDKIWE